MLPPVELPSGYDSAKTFLRYVMIGCIIIGSIGVNNVSLAYAFFERWNVE